ncbi:30S ribosomal protein S9 [Candidatus Woesearchaeota archaeon CG1_02_57_44]|nr:MAG: 30S ribosomal protein S9 [Candidatus Woesearchaeota archaeon CG1_02_57_44]
MSSGKRKNAHAHASIVKGKGRVRVNSFSIDQVQPTMARLKIMEPILLAGDVAKGLDISIRTEGGGVIGQAEAARLAIGKALVEHDESLREVFRAYDRHLLVADVRQREPRKPNTHGKARSKTQKSYR